jgi:diguanylate cyclase (GGDEF)-like protein
MADIDHFKNVNDHYGHLAGDEVLRFLGKLIRQHARGSDVFCRYGGEEFLLILPNMAKDNAVKRAEELRCTIEAVLIHYDKLLISVTCSFGVSIYPSDGLDSDALIAAADSAMYESKMTGRNRVTCFSKVRLNGNP